MNPAEFEAQLRATNDRIQQRAGRNLALAVLLGLVLGLALLASILFAKELFMLFGGALVAFTAWELASALRVAGRDVPRIPTVIGAIGVVPASFYGLEAGHWYATLAAIALVVLWRCAELVRPSHRTGAGAFWRDIGAGVLVQVYVVFLGGFAFVLTAREDGQWWTLAFLIAVVCVDIGAYASGVAFGKHPMVPRISPKKTWEGFAGSAVVGLVAGVLLAIFMLDVPWQAGVLFGAVIVVTATSGDLVESQIKRDIGVKDISSWLPGHGGFLDRLDSILPSAAAAYLLYAVLT